MWKPHLIDRINGSRIAYLASQQLATGGCLEERALVISRDWFVKYHCCAIYITLHTYIRFHHSSQSEVVVVVLSDDLGNLLLGLVLGALAVNEVKLERKVDQPQNQGRW